MAKDERERKRHWITLAVLGGGGLIVFVWLDRSAASSAAARPSSSQLANQKPQFQPNPANPQLEAAILAARSNAINTYDQSAIAEHSLTTQQQISDAQIKSNQAIAFNTNATQEAMNAATVAAEQAIAHMQVGLQENLASQQASAMGQYEHAQQQGGLWNSIIGAIGSIFPFFSGMMMPPGSGTGYVDSATGLPLTESQFYSDPYAVNPYGAMETPQMLPQPPSIWPGGGPTIP